MQITSYEPQTVKVQENIPLAPLTTLQVGGAARYFAELKREDTQKRLRPVREEQRPKQLDPRRRGGHSLAWLGWDSCYDHPSGITGFH